MEAVIYASEEPVTLGQLVSLLGQEAQAELDAAAALQGQLALIDAEPVLLVEVEPDDQDALNAEVTGSEDFPAVAPEPEADEPGESANGSGMASSVQEMKAESGSADPPSASTQEDEPTGSDATAISGIPGESTPTELRARERRLREYMRSVLESLIAEYAEGDRGLEIREVAGGFRLATKPEYHDAVRGFVRSLKPPLKLSLQALETLAVVAYKQPVTAPEVSEIRGVDSGGVLGSLMTRKLVTTAGRKQVIGRPILYKTTKEFLLRFGLKDLAELPSIEEFERMAGAMNEAVQEEIPMVEAPEESRSETGERRSPAMDELNAAPEPTNGVHGSAYAMIGDRSAAPEGGAREPEDVAIAGRSEDQHEAQADGIPDRDAARGTDDERLTSAPDAPGEFAGNETAPPADNVEVDGRISGIPPDYTDADNPSAHDAGVQSGEDD